MVKGITKKSAQQAAIAHNKKVCIKSVSTKSKAALVSALKKVGKTPASVARAPRKAGAKKPGPKKGSTRIDLTLFPASRYGTAAKKPGPKKGSTRIDPTLFPASRYMHLKGRKKPGPKPSKGPVFG
jgi:hypothetical protein